MFTTLIDPIPAPAEGADALARFLQLLGAALGTRTLLKLSLSQPHAGTAVAAGAAEAPAARVLGRRVELRGQAHLQLVHRHPTKDITKNHPADEAAAVIAELLTQTYRHAHLQTPTHELNLTLKHKGGRDKSYLQVLKRAAPPKAAPLSTAGAAVSQGDTEAETGEDPASHNRAKHRLLDLADPVWGPLGISHRPHGTPVLVPAMARKWKQINRFTEIFSQAIEQAGLATRDTVRVIDFGCGKGYLTFAVHAWLRSQGREPVVTGVELRQSLVDDCNAIARGAGREGLRFDAGDVRDYTPPAQDVVIALHACDTATDHAIHLGLRAGASVILCSPCCHKEIRPQMRSPAALRPLLQHGVHLGQEAEMVTDSLRALLLEAAGYEARIFEFVSLEHTNKNKMILAIRRPDTTAAERDAARQQVAEIKAFYGLRAQSLEVLLDSHTMA